MYNVVTAGVHHFETVRIGERERSPVSLWTQIEPVIMKRDRGKVNRRRPMLLMLMLMLMMFMMTVVMIMVALFSMMVIVMMIMMLMLMGYCRCKRCHLRRIQFGNGYELLSGILNWSRRSLLMLMLQRIGSIWIIWTQ